MRVAATLFFGAFPGGRGSFCRCAGASALTSPLRKGVGQLSRVLTQGGSAAPSREAAAAGAQPLLSCFRG